MALSTTLIFLMTNLSLSVLSHRMAGFTVMVLNSIGLFLFITARLQESLEVFEMLFAAFNANQAAAFV